jgi:chromate transport protein ChrA
MARTLCPDRERASIAVVTALIILFSASSIAQISGILLGGIAGLWLCRGSPPTATGHIMMPVSRTAGMVLAPRHQTRPAARLMTAITISVLVSSCDGGGGG